MKNGELIKELQKYPLDYDVMVEGKSAEKVVVETCQGHSYLRIFEPWDVDFVMGSAGLTEQTNE